MLRSDSLAMTDDEAKAMQEPAPEIGFMPFPLSRPSGSGSFPDFSALRAEQDPYQLMASFGEQSSPSGTMSRASSDGLGLPFTSLGSMSGASSGGFGLPSTSSGSSAPSGSFGLPLTSSGSSDEPSLAHPSLLNPNALSVNVAPPAAASLSRSSSVSLAPEGALLSPVALMQSSAQSEVSGRTQAAHAPLQLPTAPMPMPMAINGFSPYPAVMGYTAFAVPRSESQTQVAQAVHTPSQSPAGPVPAIVLTATQTQQAPGATSTSKSEAIPAPAAEAKSALASSASITSSLNRRDRKRKAPSRDVNQSGQAKKPKEAKEPKKPKKPKQTLYTERQKFAINRPRVGGRFVKMDEATRQSLMSSQSGSASAPSVTSGSSIKNR